MEPHVHALARPPFFASARGRLLIFNLLVVAVTLMVSGVAVLGFRHASQIQEQVQQQTLDDMTGSMNLARDTANVATAAVRLSQVVGALEYQGEAERLKQTQMALHHSLRQLAGAPLAQQEPALVARIRQRSNELQQSVTVMLERGQQRHLERNALLSSLYQNQSYLRHLQAIIDLQASNGAFNCLLRSSEMDRADHRRHSVRHAAGRSATAQQRAADLVCAAAAGRAGDSSARGWSCTSQASCCRCPVSWRRAIWR